MNLRNLLLGRAVRFQINKQTLDEIFKRNVRRLKSAPNQNKSLTRWIKNVFVLIRSDHKRLALY